MKYFLAIFRKGRGSYLAPNVPVRNLRNISKHTATLHRAAFGARRGSSTRVRLISNVAGNPLGHARGQEAPWVGDILLIRRCVHRQRLYRYWGQAWRSSHHADIHTFEEKSRNNPVAASTYLPAVQLQVHANAPSVYSIAGG